MLRILYGVCLVLTGAMSGAWADPALWVARSSTAAVYLFGTVHVLPKAGAQGWMGPAIRDALAASSEIWTEADVGDLAGSVGALRRYGLDPAHDTAALLPPGYRTRYLQQIARAGLPVVLATHARPWLAALLLEVVAMQQAAPMGLGAEATLLDYARAHRLRTASFETVEEQFGLLAGLPPDVQLASLEEEIDLFDRTGVLFAQMLAAWRSGDEAALDRLSNQDMQAHDPAVWTALILRRNERFARRIGETLRGSGTAFVAVGAAHLCGASGVPALLGRAGFSVTRLQ